MDGVFLINKQVGWTSFDVCAKMRKKMDTKKVGHTGTLDPFAEGLMIVTLGKATKIIPYLETLDKESLFFWNSLFTKFSGSEVRRYLFQTDEDQNEVITSCNLYLQSEKNYHNLKSNLETVVPNFLKGNILQYPFYKNYDNIWLSNIGSYLNVDDIKNIAKIIPNYLTD